MGFFDFLKRKNTVVTEPEFGKEAIRPSKKESNPKFTKEEVDTLVLQAVNLLCDGKSTLGDAEKFIQEKGYDERESGIIAQRANELYVKHLAVTNPPDPELFALVARYQEYVMRYVNIQLNGSYAPISAYEKLDGELIGFLYIEDENNSYSLSAEEVITNMETRFEKKLSNNEIKSYTIMYHSQFANDNNHKIATTDEELKAITVIYNFGNGKEGKIAMPYSFEGDELTFQGFTNFSKEENDTILSTQLTEDKDYFQEKEVMKAPTVENEVGIKIISSNTGNMHNTWSGIFGYPSNSDEKGQQRIMEYFALALTKEAVFSNANMKISQLDYSDVILKAISIDDNPKSFLPIVKTTYTLDIETINIIEWENVSNLEAIITGSGRDTFGLSYFATDYAEHSEKYKSQKKLNINLSGIALVLDVSTMDTEVGDMKLSENFTTYMPNKDLKGFACYDIIGELENFREIKLMEEEDSMNGYILKIRLITNDEIKDFFTIDVYAHPENIRFSDLKIGMKLSGLVQFQGCISDN